MLGKSNTRTEYENADSCKPNNHPRAAIYSVFPFRISLPFHK